MGAAESLSSVLSSDSFFAKLNFFLLILASVGIWLWSDALTVEVPFLVPILPEGWRLGSFLVLMKGLSTSSLLLLPLFLKRGIITACLICYGLGFLLSISICFLWDQKIGPTNLFPDGLSIGFLANAFCLMGLDSLRMTLVFMLATSMFSESFITAVLIGDACGGVFASGISYIQGYKLFFRSATNSVSQDTLSKDYVFGPQTALLFLAFVFTTCFASLGWLIYRNKNDRKAKYSALTKGEAEKSETSPLNSANIYSQNHKYFLWFNWFAASGSVFTLMPAFHSFSTLPYSQRCFMLAVSFWALSFPLTAIFAHFVRLRKMFSLLICLILHVVVCGVLIFIASQSPHPPLQGYKLAEPMMILLWIAQGSSGFFLFCTASNCLREIDENAVKYGSIAAQLGDVVCSLLSFTLINVSNFFVEPSDE